MLALNFKNIDYELVNMTVSQHRSVRTYSDTSKLPCIQHKGQYINDSTDIIYYLEEQFPTHKLIPKDPIIQDLCHVYEDWADESLNFYMMKLRWLPQNRRRWAKELGKRDKGLIRLLVEKISHKATLAILDKQGIGRKSLDQTINDLHRHLKSINTAVTESGYIVGDKISMADISIYTQIYWIQKNPEGEIAIAKHDNLGKWMTKIKTLTLDTRI
tara:strand:+ start:674 stop:1318 length:645 start_codon:yes stop_codon:yes gene_type:complete